MLKLNNLKNNITRIFLLIVICFIPFFVTGCGDDKEVGILFNSEPITKENVLHSSRTFEAGKRIYYLFYSDKKIKTEFIRVQLFKAEEKVPLGGYSILMTNDYRIMKQNQYYYYNHFTVHQPGRYVLQVFSVNDISKPLAWNYFYVY